MPKNIDKNQYDKAFTADEDDRDGESGSSSSGGKSGQIEFKEFVVKAETLREDLLPPEERRRLLIVHSQMNETGVKKQKALRDEYKALKEGRTNLNDFRQARMNQSGYKPHTILADKRQFSGSDKQVNPLGNDNVAETNNDKKNELQLRYDRQNRPEMAPRAAPPKPSPFGGKM